MAVLINEFEIVLDPPAAEQPPPRNDGAARAMPADAPLPLRPADLMSIALHLARRKERVRAH
jgi:hypothetical protein